MANGVISGINIAGWRRNMAGRKYVNVISISM
jgi:hypothetical protein